MRLRTLLAFALCLVSQPVYADEILELEALVRAQPAQSSIKSRLERFLRKKKCKSPEYYSRLIDAKFTTDEEKKRWAARLVIESRGDAGAVSSEGALGPWQLHPTWCKVFKISKRAAKNPQKNLELCKRVFQEHLSDRRGNVRKAEYDYSGGSKWYPGKIDQLMREV